MSNIWFPVPIALFFRRVVNVLSTISITHHYLLPRRSTEKHDPELQSQRADRVLLANGQLDAERYALWTTIVENGLDSILQGVYAPSRLTSARALTLLSCPSVASGKLSIPWLQWPARLSLFYPTSTFNNHVQNLNDETGSKNSSSDLSSCARPQGQPEPSEPGREDREGLDEIHRLIQSPVLYDPLRAPRYPIVLCHGAPLLARRSIEDREIFFHLRLVWF
jgi:triacylglycerol lipase